MESLTIVAKNADAAWLLYSLMVAALGLFFQACMEPGMIFRRYYLYLTHHWITNWRRERRWRRFWLKPLGLCVYCNTTWIGLVFYLVYFGLHLEILLFAGLVYAWLKAFQRLGFF